MPEQSPEALEELIGRVAHDLTSPLAAISMACQTMRTIGGRSEETQLQLVDLIERQARRGMTLVRGLLDLTHASRAPARQPVDVGGLVEEVAQEVEGLALRNECAGVVVDADPTSLRQALVHLLANAVTFAAKEGNADVTVGCEPSGAGHRIWVADRGPGVPDEDRERILRPFERGREAGPEGSGLGLAVVAATAAAHDGTAGVEARPGGGAVFWLTVAGGGPPGHH